MLLDIVETFSKVWSDVGLKMLSAIANAIELVVDAFNI